jgi:hypothetical protein
MNKNDLWNLVQYNDRKIYDLATYCETKGFANKSDPDKVMVRFSEFKKRILMGSLTLAQLETDVLKKYGVTEGSQYVSAPVEALPSDIKKLIEELSVGVEE